MSSIGMVDWSNCEPRVDARVLDYEIWWCYRNDAGEYWVTWKGEMLRQQDTPFSTYDDLRMFLNSHINARFPKMFEHFDKSIVWEIESDID